MLNTSQVGCLTPYHGPKGLGVKFVELEAIGHKIATYYRNMYRLQKAYIVIYVNQWAMMKIIAEHMTL